MPVYAAREIYRFARLAGFTPDQATTMTAVALAESGGNSGAHNPHGEDSRGLWQINANAHPNLAGHNLYDPLENAKAAYQVSHGGQDISPWTTTHGGMDASYVAHRAEAQAAAVASGDPAGGVWSGTQGYGHPLAASGGDLHPAGGGPLQTFLDSALAQDGDPYVWGAEANVSDADPHAFDCSELIQWAAGRAGVELPDGSWNQYLAMEQAHSTMSVDQALHTPGALLFSFSSTPTAGAGRPSQAHVAISLGDGRTIEAQSPETGVGVHQAGHRFNYAAVVPGLAGGPGGYSPSYAASTSLGPEGTLALTGAGQDSDKDGLTDVLEAKLGLNAHAADSDGDHVSDGYELLKMRTNAGLADTDKDGLTDSLELALRTNPLDPDSDQDGQVDGVTNIRGGRLDTDKDGVSDVLERILGTNPLSADSDGDGFTDGAEYRNAFDPTQATSNPLASVTGGTDPLAMPGSLPGAGATSPLTQQLAAAPPEDPTWGLGGHPGSADLDLTS
jgi:cell wall-associated NlpC family hydrolase